MVADPLLKKEQPQQESISVRTRKNEKKDFSFIDSLKPFRLLIKSHCPCVAKQGVMLI